VSVVPDNRPGAGTVIAHTLGARAAPDGYTLVLGSSSALTTNPAFGGKLDYDSVKDFAPVGLAAYVPQLLVVHPSVPAKTLSELFELAKAQPGKITIQQVHRVDRHGVGRQHAAGTAGMDTQRTGRKWCAIQVFGDRGADAGCARLDLNQAQPVDSLDGGRPIGLACIPVRLAGV
jgi:tripartite-type tricarboxylate transporter receptor subunit TctC